MKTADDLVKIRELVADGNSLSGAYFKMTDDITLPEHWQPIGCTKDGTSNIQSGANLNAFSGTIDGYGKTLTVEQNSDEEFKFNLCFFDISEHN